MYHSLYFAPSPEVFQSGIIDGDATSRSLVKDIWEDWRLVSSSRPLLAPPKPKTNYVNIPGGDGALDLTEALTGFPIYNNREGSWDFYVTDRDWDWVDAYSTIMNFLHGQKMCVILEDDMSHYYEGRFTVNSWRSDPSYSRISINYSVDPYKYTVLQNDWYWNRFDFGGPLYDTNQNEVNMSDTEYGEWLSSNYVIGWDGSFINLKKGDANLIGHLFDFANNSDVIEGSMNLAFVGGAISEYTDREIDGSLEMQITGLGKQIVPTFQTVINGIYPEGAVVTYEDVWEFTTVSNRKKLGWLRPEDDPYYRVGDYAPAYAKMKGSAGTITFSDGTNKTLTKTDGGYNSGVYALVNNNIVYVVCVPNELPDTPAGTYFLRRDNDAWSTATLCWNQDPDPEYGITVQMTDGAGKKTSRFLLNPNGKSYIPDITIRAGENKLLFTGYGTVTLNYRGASL